MGGSLPREVKETLVCVNKVTFQLFSARFPEIPRYLRSQNPYYNFSFIKLTNRIQRNMTQMEVDEVRSFVRVHLWMQTELLGLFVGLLKWSCCLHRR